VQHGVANESLTLVSSSNISNFHSGLQSRPVLPRSIPTMRGFKIASLNITSLIKHIDELRVFLAVNPIDVLAINESRLDSSITDNELYIPGYDIVRRDRGVNGSP